MREQVENYLQTAAETDDLKMDTVAEIVEALNVVHRKSESRQFYLAAEYDFGAEPADDFHEFRVPAIQSTYCVRKDEKGQVTEIRLQTPLPKAF